MCKLRLKCEMSQEEKYKLALFAVVRNSKVMPAGVKLGKERLKESYESV